MRLLWLADAFRAKGLPVVEEPGWRTRGKDWSSGEPSGMMQHHTAPPVPYPVKALYANGRIKCNFNVKPDGTIHVVAAGRCNYSSGSGSKRVLNEVRQDIAPSGSARSRGLIDNWGGNRYYINNETDHAGDGSPIPVAQYQSVVYAWAAIVERIPYFTTNRIVAHAEHTRRKIDPRWSSRQAHPNLEILRADVQAALGGTPPPIAQEDYMLPLAYGDGYSTPPPDSVYVGQDRSHRREDVSYAQLIAGSGVDGFYGTNTAADFVAAGVPGDGRTIDHEGWDVLLAGRYAVTIGDHTHPFEGNTGGIST